MRTVAGGGQVKVPPYPVLVLAGRWAGAAKHQVFDFDETDTLTRAGPCRIRRARFWGSKVSNAVRCGHGRDRPTASITRRVTLAMIATGYGLYKPLATGTWPRRRRPP